LDNGKVKVNMKIDIKPSIITYYRGSEYFFFASSLVLSPDLFILVEGY